MQYSTNKETFLKEQAEKNVAYYKTNKKKLSGFNSQKEFCEWLSTELQKSEAKCHYCETSILDIRRLLNKGLILGRKIGYGYRGPNLEIDRKDPFGNYCAENCVLCCYYCNNDKSNTYSYQIYKDIFGAIRSNAMKKIIANLNQNEKRSIDACAVN
jgi:hypothetical protein